MKTRAARPWTAIDEIEAVNEECYFMCLSEDHRVHGLQFQSVYSFRVFFQSDHLLPSYVFVHFSQRYVPYVLVLNKFNSILLKETSVKCRGRLVPALVFYYCNMIPKCLQLKYIHGQKMPPVLKYMQMHEFMARKTVVRMRKRPGTICQDTARSCYVFCFKEEGWNRWTRSNRSLAGRRKSPEAHALITQSHHYYILTYYIHTIWRKGGVKERKTSSLAD